MQNPLQQILLSVRLHHGWIVLKVNLFLEEVMSGHNKWSSIKHKKAKEDAKRGKVFTKLIRELTIAARSGGGDPEGNPRLRQAIIAAKAANMPSENIDRAIKRGTGELEGVSYEEVTYEGYGPGGVAILVEVQTDNKNRIVSEVKKMFSKAGGSLGEPNSVGWMFDSRGLIEVKCDGSREDELMETALDAGADDLESAGEVYNVYTEPSALTDVTEALQKAGYEVLSSKQAKIPKTQVKVSGKQAESLLKLLDNLEDNDDVQNVWANFDIDEEEMERILGA